MRFRDPENEVPGMGPGGCLGGYPGRVPGRVSWEGYMRVLAGIYPSVGPWQYQRVYHPGYTPLPGYTAPPMQYTVVQAARLDRALLNA